MAGLGQGGLWKAGEAGTDPGSELALGPTSFVILSGLPSLSMSPFSHQQNIGTNSS